MVVKDLIAIYFVVAGATIMFIPYSDAKLVNCSIMALYLVCAAWWAWHGHYVDTCYWLSALAITATVTFGYTR